MVRRRTNRRHMTGDHHGREAQRATLLVRVMDEILGTRSVCTLHRTVRIPESARTASNAAVKFEPRSRIMSLTRCA